MSDITIAAAILAAGAVCAIVLWQVFEIGKERSRDGEGEEAPLARKVQALEGRVRELESLGPGGGR
jgi:hypothetical protein